MLPEACSSLCRNSGRPAREETATSAAERSACTSRRPARKNQVNPQSAFKTIGSQGKALKVAPTGNPGAPWKLLYHT